jgi:uncharacterized protein with PQ loop repeat
MQIENIQVIAGAISSAMFILGTLPMLLKAWRTKDMHSYSFSNIALSNLGNAVHWLYILSLPVGPIWFLHGFHTVATLLMLIWYVAYTRRETVRRASSL